MNEKSLEFSLSIIINRARAARNVNFRYEKNWFFFGSLFTVTQMCVYRILQLHLQSIATMYKDTRIHVANNNVATQKFQHKKMFSTKHKRNRTVCELLRLRRTVFGSERARMRTFFARFTLHGTGHAWIRAGKRHMKHPQQM